MKTGTCIKCSAETVYYSDGKGSKYGLRTGDSAPYLSIYKDRKWIPDIHSSHMDSYVCRTCGYFEMFARDLDILEKLDDCDNWQKVEAN